MRGRTWLVSGGLITVALAVTLATYNDAGDLSISNESSTEVTVMTGDTKATVPATGGTVLLDYGCTPGDVTVKVASSPAVVVPGPVCPEQQIVIRGDGKVELQPASANNT